MTTNQKLPEARLVPRNAEDRMTILRSHANDGARKAARVTVKLCRVVTVLAICGAGFAALNAGIDSGSRSRSFDDRRIESLRRMNLEMPKFDRLQFDDLRLQIQRDLLDPRLHDFRARQLQLENRSWLESEDIH